MGKKDRRLETRCALLSIKGDPGPQGGSVKKTKGEAKLQLAATTIGREEKTQEPCIE